MATAFRRPRPKQLSVLDVLIHPLITLKSVGFLSFFVLVSVLQPIVAAVVATPSYSSLLLVLPENGRGLWPTPSASFTPKWGKGTKCVF